MTDFPARPVDLEENMNKKELDTWKDDDLLHNVFNEMQDVKAAFRYMRRQVVILFGMLLVLVLLGVAGTYANLKHSKKITVDSNTFRMTTKNGDSVGTVGIGQTFRLPLYTFPESEDDVNSSRPHPYVCVGVPSVADMWRSTFYGVTTNAVVYGVLEDHYKPEEFEGGAAGFGVTLSFQGSYQNRTHACLSTMDRDLAICINFASTNCGTAVGAKEVTRHFERRLADEDIVNAKRSLFNELVYDDREEMDEEGNVIHPGARRLGKNCPHGHWCQDFAALELIGTDW